LGAEDKILQIEERIFQDLISFLKDFTPSIQQNASTIAQLDCLLSHAMLAKTKNYVMPLVNDSFEIDIKAGKHPVIEAQLPIGTPYVPNDVFLDDTTQQIIMITGPNMSGKSALLRQTALIVLMAQTGSFVPAEAAKHRAR
jgi:DNA mismatch repair protein MutS